MSDVTPNTPTPVEPVETPVAAPVAEAAPETKTEAKPETKPEEKRERVSPKVAAAVRAQREAAAKVKEAEQLRAEVEPVLGAISAKDLGKLQDFLAAKGITFADLVAYNSGLGADDENPLATEVASLKAKLDERDAAEKAAADAKAKAEYEAAEAEMLQDVAKVAADFPLLSRAGTSAQKDVLQLVNDAWEEDGRPPLSPSEIRDAIAAACKVVDSRIKQQIAPFIEALAPKAPEAAPAAPEAVRPNTITSTIGGGSGATRTPPKLMSREESVAFALAQVGVR